MAATVIHAPESSDRDELARWTRSKLLWVHRKLIRKAEAAASRREPEFVSGESFCYLGKAFRLKLIRGAEEPLSFDGRNFLLHLGARQTAAEYFRRWYIDTGSVWLNNRVRILSRRLGVHATCVDVRDLGYRWGSCGKNGVVFFNWKLLQFPVRLIDYVIMHELAHLIEPHHGQGLWDVLDRSLPDWRIRAEELRIRAGEFFWCHERVK